MMRVPHRNLAAGLALAAGFLLTACGTSPAASGPQTTTPADEPGTASETTGPSGNPDDPTATSDPSTPAQPQADPVLLSAQGVGDLAWDSPGAEAAVEDLLGPPTSIDPFPETCGVSGVEQLSYGGATINVQDDTLFSWTITQAEPVPPVVSLPHGIGIGSPWSQVTALSEAQPVTFLDNYQVFQVEVDEGDASLFYWANDDAPTSDVVLVAGRYLLGCS